MSARGVMHRLTRPRKLIILAATCCLALFAVLLTISPHGSAPTAPPVAKHFTLPALGHPGSSVSLNQYAGRPVAVKNFFSSTCAPCREEAPLLARFYRSHRGHVAIVGIDVADIATAALRFARQAGISYPIGSDPTATTADAYSVIATPQTFFLNADHRIVNRIFGPLTLGDLSTVCSNALILLTDLLTTALDSTLDETRAVGEMVSPRAGQEPNPGHQWTTLILIRIRRSVPGGQMNATVPGCLSLLVTEGTLRGRTTRKGRMIKMRGCSCGHGSSCSCPRGCSCGCNG